MIESLDQNQIIFIIIAMAISAVPVGVMAGLFGIGGGLITVPVLFYIFNSVGLDQTYVMHLAVGTSFSIIIPTSIISTMTHMKYKAVDLKIVKTFGIFVILGLMSYTLTSYPCFIKFFNIGKPILPAPTKPIDWEVLLLIFIYFSFRISNGNIWT